MPTRQVGHRQPPVLFAEKLKDFLALVRQCLRNDPFAVCWECSSARLNKSKPNEAVPTLRNIVGRLADVFVLALRSLWDPTDWSKSIEARIFFLVKTANQAHAVQPIIDRLGETAVKSDAALLKWMSQRAARYALPFLPVLIFRTLLASKYQRSTLARHFVDYWLSYGLFIAAWVALRKRPHVIVLTNDHAPLPRAVALAAKFLRIPTAFVPHAGVMEGLPPLQFDVAFLDGLRSAQKYSEFGSSNTTVLLAGNCRLDSILRRPRSTRGRIAVCPAFGDDPDDVLQLLSALTRVLS